MVERAAVNRDVAGSSPASGAIFYLWPGIGGDVPCKTRQAVSSPGTPAICLCILTTAGTRPRQSSPARTVPGKWFGPERTQSKLLSEAQQMASLCQTTCGVLRPKRQNVPRTEVQLRPAGRLHRARGARGSAGGFGPETKANRTGNRGRQTGPAQREKILNPPDAGKGFPYHP